MANINTDFFRVKNRPPGQYRDEKLSGFIVKISETGVCSYQVHGRIKGGVLVRHTIGKHGAPWTPKMARDEAERIIHLMKLGIDPRAVKAERIAEKAAIVTLKHNEDLRNSLTIRRAFQEWCADEKKTQQSTKDLYRDCLYKHLKDWLDLPLVGVSEEMVVKRYDKVADETVSSANNTFRALRRVFYWSMEEYLDAEKKPILLTNPVRVLSKRNKWRKLPPRRDLIDFKNLSKWFDAVCSLKNHTYRDYYIFILLTGLRRDEAATLLWRKVNFEKGAFTVRRKGGLEQELPLTNYMKMFLRDRQSNPNRELFVFPGKGKTGHIVDARYYQDQVVESSGVIFTPHALRRTFSYASAKVKLGESERKALLDHHDKSDVTDFHYTPWEVDDLREPLEQVETFILSHRHSPVVK